MLNITIHEHGTFLGLHSERLAVKQDGQTIREIPLSRIRQIAISRKGVSISSDLILELANRGVKLVFQDFRGLPSAIVSSSSQHAVVNLRRKQFACEASHHQFELSRQIVIGKIKNQQAVLNYFKKGGVPSEAAGQILEGAIGHLADCLTEVKILAQKEDWRNILMGYAGKAAALYWDTFAGGLGIERFEKRIKRGATDTVNAMLNYAYGVLMYQVWGAVLNAGLEPYLGMYHVDAPGKPALVLDLMEEFRPWVSDRIVIRILRSMDEAPDQFTQPLKSNLLDALQKTLTTKYPLKKNRFTLQTIIQKQVYAFAGAIAEGKKYRTYHFKW